VLCVATRVSKSRVAMHAVSRNGATRLCSRLNQKTIYTNFSTFSYCNMHSHTQVDDRTDDRLVVAGSSCTDACTTMISFDGSVRKTNFFKDGEEESTEQQQQHRAEDEATKNFHGNEGGLKAAVLVAKRLKRLPHAAGEAQSEEEECRPDQPRIINESKDYSGQELWCLCQPGSYPESLSAQSG